MDTNRVQILAVARNAGVELPAKSLKRRRCPSPDKADLTPEAAAHVAQLRGDLTVRISEIVELRKQVKAQGEKVAEMERALEEERKLLKT